MKKLVFFTSLLFLAFSLTAQDQSGNGITSSDELTLQFTTLPEAQLNYTRRYNIPFLQGSNPLTSGNNIALALTAELTPISVNAVADAVWTPIAFFNVSLGGRIGSGWNMELFGMELIGIGNNIKDVSGSTNDGNAFDGIHWRAKTGATLQFDMAAIFPGDWNHIVMQTYHEINYKGYSDAANGTSWYYLNDSGENRNGFNYYGNLLLGYQMPIFLNTVGFMAEANLYLYDTPNRSNWGDDLVRWTFAAAANFTITEQLGASLILQFHTRRNYTQGTEGSNKVKSTYYQDRNLIEDDPLSLQFFRVALGFTYKF
jgi:hypothetical protein